MEEKNNKKNTIAIVGFVLSFFTTFIGLILSIIGLSKSKELNDGKGFSIAGIIISSLRLLLAIIVIIFALFFTNNTIKVYDFSNGLFNSQEFKDIIESNEGNDIVKDIVNEDNKEDKYEDMKIPVVNYGSNMDVKYIENSESKIKLVINDEYYDFEISSIETGFCGFPKTIILLDNDYFLVLFDDCNEGGHGMVYDKDGKKVYDMSKFVDLKIHLYDVIFEDDKIKGFALGYSPDYEFAACRYKPSDIAFAEIEFEYIGDGKFNSNILSSATSDEVVKGKYGMSCEEIKNSTSDELSYERYYVNSYNN